MAPASHRSSIKGWCSSADLRCHPTRNNTGLSIATQSVIDEPHLAHYDGSTHDEVVTGTGAGVGHVAPTEAGVLANACFTGHCSVINYYTTLLLLAISLWIAIGLPSNIGSCHTSASRGMAFRLSPPARSAKRASGTAANILLRKQCVPVRSPRCSCTSAYNACTHHGHTGPPM